MNFKELFKGTNCCFAIVFLLCLFTSNKVNAQDVTVEGIVKDASGLTLPGVNVLEKGTKNGISTDFDGKYKIKLTNAKATLVFSFIGFTTQATAVAGRNKVNVVLTEESNALNEVVVVGYGTVKKSDLTGAVSSISGSTLAKIPVSNVAEALTGRIAGVQVTAPDGAPDAEIKIRVRGGGSLTQDASPLIIVDGFPVNNMSDIAASNIESMTVLKDASSTAIYGSRGANGVIIITTKTGKNGKMSVSYNMFYGMKKMAKDIDVLPANDFVKWQYEYAMLTNTDATITSNPSKYTDYFGNWQDRDLYDGVKGTNWQKQLYGRTGEVQSRDLGIRGGTEMLNYNFNFTHYDEKAIMIGSNYKRNNLSLALKNKMSEKVDLAFTVRYSDTEIKGSGANDQSGSNISESRLRQAIGYSPLPLVGVTGDEEQEINGYLVNPFVSVADNDRKQLRKNYNLLGSFGWKIVKNLKFQTDLGLDNYNNLDYRFYGSTTTFSTTAKFGSGNPGMVMSDRKDVRFRNANTLNYDFKELLGDKHHLTALLGEEMITTKSNTTSSTILDYPDFFNLDQAIKLTTQGTPLTVDNYYSPDDKLLSFFGRVNYDFKDRYLFTATFRADGSSKFYGNNRWGYFPAAAAGWKISEESFLKNVSWLDNLKVRVSYGEAGNNNIPVGQTTLAFGPETNATMNGFDNYWKVGDDLINPDLKWETTVTQNIGLDFGFFKNRLSGTLDVYKNLTQDLLLRFPVGGSGYDFQYRNMGETQNTGVEATLNFTAVEKKNFGLNFSVNIGVNKNRINSLGLMDNFGAKSGWASTDIAGDDYLVNIGSPIGIMYGYQSDGRYEVSDFDYDAGTGKYTLKAGVANGVDIMGTEMKPGMMKLKNTDGSADNKVTASDQKAIGDANPKHTGGLVINANAYGFDLSAAFNWSVGNDIYNANKAEFGTANRNGQYKNLSTEMADGTRWTNINPDTGELVTNPTDLEALNANTTMWSPYMQRFFFTDWAVEDGSFFRLNTLTLGYSTPEALTSKLGASKLRFYLTATNVFIITNYSGPDPEVSTVRRTPLTPGVDYSAYPRSRQLVFGLNLNF